MNQQMIFKMGRLFHEPILPFLKCEKWSESSLCSFTSLALMFKTFSTFWAGSCGPSPLAPNSRAFLVYEIIVIKIMNNITERYKLGGLNVIHGTDEKEK